MTNDEKQYMGNVDVNEVGFTSTAPIFIRSERKHTTSSVPDWITYSFRVESSCTRPMTLMDCSANPLSSNGRTRVSAIKVRWHRSQGVLWLIDLRPVAYRLARVSWPTSRRRIASFTAPSQVVDHVHFQLFSIASPRSGSTISLSNGTPGS